MNWPVFLGSLAAAGAPIGFLTYKHVHWMHTPESKRRILIQFAAFWSSVALSLWWMHDTHFRKLIPATKTLRYGLGALLPVGGFWLGKRMAVQAYPFQDKAQIGQKKIPPHLPTDQPQLERKSALPDVKSFSPALGETVKPLPQYATSPARYVYSPMYPSILYAPTYF